MSLISDALKRAKDAQHQTSVSDLPGLQLRPADPSPGVRFGIGFGVPIVLCLIALVGLFFTWQRAQRVHLAQGASRTDAPAAAAVKPHPANALSPAAPPTAPAAKPSAVPEKTADTPPPAPVASPPTNAAPPAPANPAPQPDSKSALSSLAAAPLPPGQPAAAGEPTNSVAPPPPPESAPLRLQGIFFNPSRPSAMIGGKMLFIGDRLGDLRLAAVTQNSATLIGPAQTNVLSLAE